MEQQSIKGREYWLLLLLLLYSAKEQGIDISEIANHELSDQQYLESCPNVEWEQDMGAHVPFCKLDNEMCNLQCRRQYSQNLQFI